MCHIFIALALHKSSTAIKLFTLKKNIKVVGPGPAEGQSPSWDPRKAYITIAIWRPLLEQTMNMTSMEENEGHAMLQMFFKLH